MGDVNTDLKPSSTQSWFSRPTVLLYRVGQIGAYVLAVVGATALAWIVYAQFIQPASIADPEAMANAWSTTVAQFGIAPIFPPQEDVRVGDLYAVLDDPKTNRRISLKAHRAIRLDHIKEADTLLTSDRKVLVLPGTPNSYAASRATITQVECGANSSCFKLEEANHQMPVVVLPGVSAASLQEAEVQGGWFDRWTRSVFAGIHHNSQSVTIEVPYAEIYGLNMIEGAGLLNIYCNNNRYVCTDKQVREQLAMIAGDEVFEADKDHTYTHPVHLVLVNAVYVVRSITYSFASDTSAGIKAQVYNRLGKKLQDDLANQTTAPTVSPGSDDPGNAANDASTRAAQRAQQQERERLIQIIAQETGMPSGGRLGASFASSDRVTIDQILPHPVAIGFIPIRKDFVKGRSDVVDSQVAGVPAVAVEPE